MISNAGFHCLQNPLTYKYSSKSCVSLQVRNRHLKIFVDEPTHQ